MPIRSGSRVAEVLLDLGDAAGAPGTAHVELVGPAGTVVALGEQTFAADAFEVRVPVTGATLDTPGVYRREAYVERAGAPTIDLPAEEMVVEESRSVWHTIATARDGWRDAPSDDVDLYSLLVAARREVADFAPAALDPVILRAAQLEQARTHWNASRTDPGGHVGDGEGFTITPFPLDWTVKQMLRPRNPRPCFG